MSEPDAQFIRGLPKAELHIHIEGSLEPELRAAIDAAFEAEGRKPPDRFWHDLIFYTCGEITRLAYVRISEEGAAPYRHYGDVTGVYRRNKELWDPLLPLLERTCTRPRTPSMETLPFGLLTSRLVSRGTRSARLAWPRRFQRRGISTSSSRASPTRLPTVRMCCSSCRAAS